MASTLHNSQRATNSGNNGPAILDKRAEITTANVNIWNTLFSVLGPFDLFGSTGNDPLLRSRRDLVIQISRLIDYPENLQISVAAIHVISDICESPVFSSSGPHSAHKLFTILEGAGELESVLESFIRRLEREESEQVSMAVGRKVNGPLVLDEDSEEFVNAFGLANLIRLQILDFFIRNIPKQGYNLSHYLLGFTFEIVEHEATIPLDAKRSFNCLHLILEILAYGLGHPSTPIVALDHPSFAHKSLQLLKILLANDRTQRVVMDLLREKENFYAVHLSNWHRSLVDEEDVGFTCFELLQKACLLDGCLLDLHQSFKDAQWSYTKKLTKVCVNATTAATLTKGKVETELQDRPPPVEASATCPDPLQTLLGDWMAALLHLMESDALKSASAEHTQMIMSCAEEYCRSICKLAKFIILALDRVPYDRKVVQGLQKTLVDSLTPLLCKLFANSNCSSAMLSDVGSLAMIQSSFYAGKSEEGVAGDELAGLVCAAIRALRRTDNNIYGRGFLYSLVVDGYGWLKRRGSCQSGAKAVIQSNITTLVDIACSDASLSFPETFSWKTMALSFITLLLANDSDFSSQTLSLIIRNGFLKSMILDMRVVDDQHLCQMITNKSYGDPIIHAWKAKLELLQAIIGCDSGTNIVAYDLCFLQVIGSLHIFDIAQLVSESLDSEGALRERWIQTIHPLLHLVNLIGVQPSTPALNSAILFVRTHAETLIRPLLNSYLETSEISLDLLFILCNLIGLHPSPPDSYRNLLIRISLDLASFAPSPSNGSSSSNVSQPTTKSSASLLSPRTATAPLQERSKIMYSIVSNLASVIIADDKMVVFSNVDLCECLRRLLDWSHKCLCSLKDTRIYFEIIDKVLMMIIYSFDRINDYSDTKTWTSAISPIIANLSKYNDDSPSTNQIHSKLMSQVDVIMKIVLE